MDTEKPFFIHAGAHRTGTSSLQMCLSLNRAVLTREGYDLAYPGRDGIPHGRLRLRLPHPRHGGRAKAEFAAKVPDELARHSSDAERPLILSEENLPGRMMHFANGQFYPAAEARFSTLKTSLPGPVRRLVFVVRSYADLYVSGYRKRAEDNPVEPFEQRHKALMGMDRGWPEVVALLRDVLAPEELLVLEYGARGSSVELLRRLVPELSTVPLTEPDRTLNRSATDAALEELQARYHDGEVLKRAEWSAVIAKHADDTTPRGLSEYSAGDREALDRRYAEDLDVLRKMPGINFQD